MSYHQRAKGGRHQDQRPAHHAGIRHGAVAIGESHRAGFHQKSDFGHGLARQPVGEGRHRRDPHLGGGGSAPLDEIHQRGFVDYRIGVGHGDDRRDATRRRRFAGRLQALAMLSARLAGNATRQSISPGARISPRQSMISGSFLSASLNRRAPTSAILPFSTSSPPLTSSPDAGSISLALRKAMRLLFMPKPLGSV